MSTIVCPKCGAELPEGKLSCEVCGASMASEYDVCPDCGSFVKKGALFCADCGAKVNDAPAPVGDFSFIEEARTEALESDQPLHTEAAESTEEAPMEDQIQSAVENAIAAEEAEVQAEAEAAAAATPEEPTTEKATEAAAVPPVQAAPPVRPAPVSASTGPIPGAVSHHRTPPPPQPQLSYPPATFAKNTQPPKGSRYAPISTWGYTGIILLFSIPVIGWIFCLVWACGGCAKINKRNLARGYILTFVLVVLVLAITGALLYFFAYSWIEPYIKMIANLDLRPVY